MIYDISQPVFSCRVFPGDSRPEKREVCRMADGALYNLTDFSMCAHNGTHIDAPRHFYADGTGVGGIPLEKCVGDAFVVTHDGELTATDAADILTAAREARPGAEKRILLKGQVTVTLEAARVFAEAGTYLVGNESQTVGPEDAPMAVHLCLLGAQTVLLEGIRLSAVPDGVYTLCCAPLDLGEADGAPCRAILMTKE